MKSRKKRIGICDFALLKTGRMRRLIGFSEESFMLSYRLALITLCLCASLNSNAQMTVNAAVSFSPTNAGMALNRSFCGLSYEKSKLTGGLFAATNNSLINMFGQIAPAVLRIGGNSVDTTCWGGISNKTPITPAQVAAFAGFINALPSNCTGKKTASKDNVRKCAGVQAARL